jgi:PAS domain S-box-containing protein
VTNLASKKLLAALDRAADAIEITTIDSRLVYVNRAFELQTGFSREEALGKRPDDLLRPPDWLEDSSYLTAEQTILKEGVWAGRYARRKKDGETIIVQMTVSPILDEDGDAENFVTISRDVTDERRRNREEKQKLKFLVEERTKELEIALGRAQQANDELSIALKTRTEFLANMSHELRTPLNAILGLCEVMLESIYGDLNEKQSNGLQTISKSGRHLLSLINDILDLSKIDSGSMPLIESEVSLRPLFESIETMFHEDLLAKNIDFQKRMEPNEIVFWGDEKRLKQIIVNLIGNSIKFTSSEGQIGLVVRAKNEAGPIHICVTDSGIGMEEKELRNIFDPFRQLNTGLNRAYEGTGLGLSLVKRFVEMHGGTIDVRSKVDQGTQIMIEFPAERHICDGRAEEEIVTEFAQTAEINIAEMAGTSETGRSILLVDDNPTNLVHIRDFLESIGYQVYESTDGAMAIQDTIEYAPDVILMDIQMPGIDGLEAIRRIRNIPEVSDIPIIAHTALAMKGDEEKCLAAGANAYCAKPVSLKKLKRMLGDLAPR